MAIRYNERGLPQFVPDEPAAPSTPGIWDEYGRPAIEAVGGILGLPLTGAGMLAGLARDSLGGTPSVRVRPDTGLWDDITGRSTTAPSAPRMAIEGAKIGALALAPGLSDTIGERLDLSQSSGLAEQSPEEIRSWQKAHPIASYAKAIAEPVAELGLGMALDPTLGAMRVLGAAAKAPALLKAAESASRAGRTLEAAEAAAKAASALRASRTMRAIAGGESEIGAVLAARPGLALGAEHALGAAFVPGMALSAVEQAKETARSYQEQGLSPDTVRGALETGASAAFAGMGLSHALRRVPKAAPATELTPERLSGALQGADLAQDIVRARAAREVAPAPEIAPSPALSEAAVAAPPPTNLAFRVRDSAESGVPVFADSHAQASRDINEVRAYAPSRQAQRGAPQEIVAVDLDRAGVPYEEQPRQGASPWIKFNEPVPETAVRKVAEPDVVDEHVASDPATALERAAAPVIPTEVLVERTGLSPERIEKGKSDVRLDKTREFSVEGQAVRRAMALDSSLVPAEILSREPSVLGPSGDSTRIRENGVPEALLLARPVAGAGNEAAIPVAPVSPAEARPGVPAVRAEVLAPQGVAVPGAPASEVSPDRASVPAVAEPIISTNRREAYQALRERYGTRPPDVKTMVDKHGVRIEWANDIRKRWGNPAWDVEAAVAPTPEAPAARPVVSDLSRSLGGMTAEGLEVRPVEEGGKSYIDLSANGLSARVNVTDGTIEAPGGRTALGEVRVPSIPINALITLTEKGATPKTVRHEVAHWLKGLLPEPERRLLDRQYGGDEGFARAYEKFVPGSGNALLQKVYDFSKPIANALLNEKQRGEAIMGLMSSGKIVQRMGGRVLTDPASRAEVGAVVESATPQTKKQVSMALARDLGVEDIVRHEKGPDRFMFDAAELLRGEVPAITRLSPMGVAFLRDVVDAKTNYGTYDAALAKARAMFGDDLKTKYEQWVNTRQLPSVGAAFERIRGDVRAGARENPASEGAIRSDLDTVMPDIKQTVGVSAVGKQIGAGAFNTLFDLGPDSSGRRVVARVSALPGDNARPRMDSQYIVPELGRYFTADKREVVISPYTYSHEEVGASPARAKKVTEEIVAKLQAEGYRSIDVSTTNVRYLDKAGTRPVVVDLGAVRPVDSAVPASEWIANKVDPKDAILYELAAFGASPGEAAYIPHIRQALSDQMSRSEFDSSLREMARSGSVSLGEHAVPGLVNAQERSEFLDSRYMSISPNVGHPQPVDMSAQESSIARALARENPQSVSQGALVYLPKLRAAMSAALPGKEFDRALLRLFRRGDLELQSHAVPSQMKPEEKAQSIQDGHGSYYMAVGVRDNAFAKYGRLAAERTREVVGSELDEALIAEARAIRESMSDPSPEKGALAERASSDRQRLEDEYQSLSESRSYKVDEGRLDYTPEELAFGRSELPLIQYTDGRFGDFMGRLRYLFADKLDYLRRAEKGVYKLHERGEVPADLSPASALELVPSRATARINDVVGGGMAEIVELAAKNGVTLEDVGDRAIAEHAPVRNRAGFDRSEGKVVDASGISDAKAAEIVAKMQADGTWEKSLPALTRYRQLLKQQRELYREYGLAPEAKISALESPEWADTYAPMKHEDLFDPWTPKSGGGGIKSPLKKFSGRSGMAENPLGYGLSQVAETIARGELNLARNRMSEFISDNPDPGWQVLDKIREKTGADGKPVPDMAWARNHVVEYMEGGQTKYIQVNDARVMESLRKAGPDTTGQLLNYISKGMRFYSGLLTRWNPEFLMTNFPRDLQMALGSIGVEHSPGMAKDVFRGVGKSIKASWKVLRNPEAAGEWEDAFKEYQRLGGPMETLQLKSGPEYQKKAEAELSRLTKPNQFKEAFRKGIDLIDRANGAVETGIRLSYFKTLKAAGMPAEAAINAAKNLTVNFDRRGALGPAMNSLYLFFNASVQGSMRVAQVLNSPRGRMAAGAMMAGGFVLDQANAAYAEDSNGDGISDWDSVPEYVKERNLLFGKMAVPMPYGFNAIVNAGRLASAVMRGQMSPGQAASHGAISVFSTFNPFGSADDFTQMVTPSFLEPMVQLATNKNFAGNAIVPDQPKWGPKKPDSERYWRTVSPASRWAAQTANTLTGGDKLTSGYVDISPATIDHWANFALGGWSRILTGGQAVVEGVASGEGVPLSKIPILRRQIYEEHPADVGRMWRATKEEMDQLLARAKMYQQEGDRESLRSLPRPLLGMSEYLSAAQRQIQDVQSAQRSGRMTLKQAEERVRQIQIKSLANVTKARDRARKMGFNGGYAAAPESGV